MALQWLVLRLASRQSTWVPQLYNKLLCKLLGLQIVVEGNTNASGLIVANHVSWKDIPVLNAVRPLSLIAKREVGSWPLFGSLARLQGTIFVNRESKRSILPSLLVIQRRLRSGETLVLFPEATTYSGKAVKPFKSSFLAAAVRTDTPVIPVTIVYQSQHGLPLTLRQRPSIAWYGDGDLAPHLWGFLIGGPVLVKLVFHEAMKPNSFANRKELAAAAEKLVRNTLAENLHAATKMR